MAKHNPNEESIIDQVMAMSAADLKNSLSSSNLTTSGNKNQLKIRLADALYQKLGIDKIVDNSYVKEGNNLVKNNRYFRVFYTAVE